MYPPHLLYLKEKGTAWFNPAYGINGFWNEYRKLAERLNKPHEYVWAHRDLKRAKEIYAISIIAMALSIQENRRGMWWIYKPVNDPPDGVIGTGVERDGLQEMHVREIEVVEHISGDLLDTVRKKLSTKNYEKNTILVCLISNGGYFDLEKEASVISKEVTSLEHIFFVFNGMLLSDVPDNLEELDTKEAASAILRVSCVQVKPVYSICTIDPDKDAKSWREGKEGTFFIFEGRGKGGSRPITLENPPKLF